MRIGVDFDNTIICYDHAFHALALEKQLIPEGLPRNKGRVRDYLHVHGREDDWTKLQGIIYGARLEEATPFSGVFDFFRFCREQNLRVFIISHKTRHPYLGPKYDLHQAAYQWLTLHGAFDEADLGLSMDNVFFELTREDKFHRIALERCTHFIDDLPEFLCEPAFPRQVVRLLFDPNGNHRTANGFERFSSWHLIHKKFQKLLV